MSEWTILCPGPSLATHALEDFHPPGPVVAVNRAHGMHLPHDYWCFVDNPWYWKDLWCDLEERHVTLWCKEFYTECMEAIGYAVEGFSLTNYKLFSRLSTAIAMAIAQTRGAKKITLYGCDLVGGVETRWADERVYMDRATTALGKVGVEVVRKEAADG